MADISTIPQNGGVRMLLEDVVESAASNESLDVHGLPPGTVVNVRTRRSEYRLEICDGSRGLVTAQGGPIFQRESLTRLNGSTRGGGTIKVGWIVTGFSLEFEDGFRRVITTPVVSVDVVAPLPNAA